jgi:hypothetical protein
VTLPRLLGAVLIVGVVWLAVLVARNTYWTAVAIPIPPKGEALTNPFYAAQKFAAALGAHTSRERALILPSTRAVIVLSAWHWDLSAQRQASLEQWVEAGGRLVVDRRLAGDLSQFQEWSGVEEDYNETAADKYYDDYDPDQPAPRCVPIPETVPDQRSSYSVCDLDFSFLTTQRPLQWALRDGNGYQAIRVAVGQGSVTVVNTVPFTQRLLLDGDHARLFVTATQLRRGDHVLFLSEDDHASLLALVWSYGGPVVALSLVTAVLVLWRGAVRFGPPAAPADAPRRSMAEQIRGTGRFVLQHGDGAPLHAASVRALTEAARRRIPAYARLPRPQRAKALGRFTGMDGDAIVSAIENVSKRRSSELHNTLSLLETARRQLLNSGG